MPTASITLSVPVEARHEAGEQRAGVDVDLREVVEEAEADDPEEAGDRQLEAAVAALLQREDAERDRPR